MHLQKWARLFLVLSCSLFSSCGGDSPTKKQEQGPDIKGPNGEPDKAGCEKLSAFSDDAGDVLDCSKEAGKKVSLRLYVKPYVGKGIKHWFDGNEKDVIKFTRKIHKLADAYKLNKWGFYFTGTRDADYFELFSDHVASEKLAGDITLDKASPAQVVSDFKPYIDEGKAYKGDKAAVRKVRETQHAVSFTTDNGTRLVVPKKSYSTIYHFSRDASDEEIADFWYHIGIEAIAERINESGPFAIHTGSVHSQMVNQLHFRIEK